MRKNPLLVLMGWDVRQYHWYLHLPHRWFHGKKLCKCSGLCFGGGQRYIGSEQHLDAILLALLNWSNFHRAFPVPA